MLSVVSDVARAAAAGTTTSSGESSCSVRSGESCCNDV